MTTGPTSPTISYGEKENMTALYYEWDVKQVNRKQLLTLFQYSKNQKRILGSRSKAKTMTENFFFPKQLKS